MLTPASDGKRIEDVEGIAEINQLMVAELEKELQLRENYVARLEDLTQVQAKQISALEFAAGELEEQTRLKTLLADKDNEIRKMSSKHEKELTTLRGELVAAQNTVKNKELEISGLETTLKLLNQDKEEVHEELGWKADRNSDLQAQIGVLTNQKQTLLEQKQHLSQAWAFESNKNQNLQIQLRQLTHERGTDTVSRQELFEARTKIQKLESALIALQSNTITGPVSTLFDVEAHLNHLIHPLNTSKTETEPQPQPATRADPLIDQRMIIRQLHLQLEQANARYALASDRVKNTEHDNNQLLQEIEVMRIACIFSEDKFKEQADIADEQLNRADQLEKELEDQREQDKMAWDNLGKMVEDRDCTIKEVKNLLRLKDQEIFVEDAWLESMLDLLFEEVRSLQQRLKAQDEVFARASQYEVDEQPKEKERKAEQLLIATDLIGQLYARLAEKRRDRACPVERPTREAEIAFGESVKLGDNPKEFQSVAPEVVEDEDLVFEL